jgi:NADP-dependent 3-hydroxy acid dehydrogenase YdfG
MIITGASSGIGAATARRMARDGLRIALAARREDRLQRLAVEVGKLGGEALVVPTDVNNYAHLENMVQTALDCWGRVDILFNNAGVAYDDTLEKMTPERIQAEVQTNLVAVIWAALAVLPVMLRQKSGHIINTASLKGLVAMPDSIVYCATKFGVVGFSDSLRRQLRGTGVHVSAFCPGNTPSEIAPAYKAHAEGRPDAPKIPGLMPNTYVADQVAGLIRRPRRMLVIPKSWRPLMLLSYLSPGLTDRLAKYFT